MVVATPDAIAVCDVIFACDASGSIINELDINCFVFCFFLSICSSRTNETEFLAKDARIAVQNDIRNT